jgi:3-hydroxyisobutyrate dehydrogenase-like beta-hydroxyacid dehydrogenase
MSEQEGTTAQCTVSVIGLGNMGSALARRFVANHHSVTVWNRSADKGAPLTKRGARVAAWLNRNWAGVRNDMEAGALLST